MKFIPRTTARIRRVLVFAGCGALLVVSGGACVLQHGTVAGRVVDCKTREPIPGAAVVASEIDWGWINGGVVWDKSYTYSAVSDGDGRFTIDYRHDDAAHLAVRKSGYRITLLDASSNRNLEVGMLAGREMDWSRNCRPSEECLKIWMEDGVQHATDICSQ